MSALPHPPAHWRECPHGDADPTTCPPCQRARQVKVVVAPEDFVIYAYRDAGHEGACPLDCGRRIEVGDPIALVGPDRQDAEWAHATCAREAVDS
jgi:hypothetical protein